MTVSYLDPENNTKDKLRLLLADTDTTGNFIWTDEELNAFLSMSDNNLYLAAARAIRALAVSKGKSAIMYRLAETLRVDKREMPRILMQLARDLDRAAMNDPAATVEYVDGFAVAYNVFSGADVSEYTTDVVD